MKLKSAILSTVIAATCLGSLAFAQEKTAPATPPATGAAPEMKLPPGWTQEDMAACMNAMTPGKEHKFLQQCVGVWKGKNTMLMYPGADPIKSESTTTVTSIHNGMFIKMDITGDMPGMGKFEAVAYNGYDNVSKNYVSTWIENTSTGIMTGTGKVSDDGKTLTWTYSYNCPITKKAAPLRQIETITGENTRTVSVWMAEPKSGKEYEMMKIELTRSK
jgi:hypothetical protein